MASGRAGRVIVVGNLKGGTGKSTVAVNVACALASRGMGVALLDADPQATAAEWVTRGDLPVWSVHLPVAGFAETERWRQQLEELRLANEIVVVDLPAVVAPVLAAAFLFANLILIPASPSAVEIAGTRRVLRFIEAARRERPHRPPLVLLVPTRVVGNGEEQAAVQALRQLGEAVGPVLTFDRSHEQAFAAGRWVGQLAPGSLAREQVAVLVDQVVAILEHGADALGEIPAAAARSGSERPRRPKLQPAAAPPGPPKARPNERAAAAQAPVIPLAWWRRLLGGRA